MRACSTATIDCLRSTVAATNAAERSALRERFGRLPSSPLTAWRRSPLWASPDAPLTGRAPPRAETGHIALLTAFRRIVAAIRVRRGRARSRQQLRELDDHLLKDIGLKREAAERNSRSRSGIGS